MSYLAYAADTSDSSWLARLEKSGSIDGLIDKYEKEYPSMSESKLYSIITADYDEKAKLLKRIRKQSYGFCYRNWHDGSVLRRLGGGRSTDIRTDLPQEERR